MDILEIQTLQKSSRNPDAVYDGCSEQFQTEVWIYLFI